MLFAPTDVIVINDFGTTVPQGLLAIVTVVDVLAWTGAPILVPSLARPKSNELTIK